MKMECKEGYIVVGAGPYINNPDWRHFQEDELNLLQPEHWANKFSPNSLSAILAEHVWEHLTIEEGVRAARVCYTYLKPGGHIRCAVPDAMFPNEEYQNIVKVGGPGPADHPAASHKVVYNYRTISEMFEAAGFVVRLLEYCDESGEFHYREWDPEMGIIFRSFRYDPRNADGVLGCVSLIVDAVKAE